MSTSNGAYVTYPLPMPWDRVYKALCRHAEGLACDQPPKPLILAGWVYSNDAEKAERWCEFQSWAIAKGCPELVELPASDLFITDEPTTQPIGPMGGPMYLRWNWTAKTCPSNEQLETSLQNLISKWAEISPEISMLTKPLRFTGKKKRALLVLADQSQVPPWGAWDSLSWQDEKRATFRQFRASINKAIAPHMVDHINFYGVTNKEML